MSINSREQATLVPDAGREWASNIDKRLSRARHLE